MSRRSARKNAFYLLFQMDFNEAVELAKKFSSDEAPAFVNGVLGKASKA